MEPTSQDNSRSPTFETGWLGGIALAGGTALAPILRGSVWVLSLHWFPMRFALSLPGFLRVYALPALWIFALPLLGWWFAGHATDRFDRDVLASIEGQISQNAKLGEEGRQEALEFFRAVPAWVACLNPAEELSGFRNSLGEACSDVRQFDWMRLLSLASVALGLVSAALALLCALAAFVSPPFHYTALLLCLNTLPSY